jgi:hypothetical protein
MRKFFDRLKREGVTWPQFFFQFVIVLLGVYLAILVERKAAERSLQEDTEVMLQNVLAELEDDEAELVRILDIQQVRLETAEALVDRLARASRDDAFAVDSLFGHYFDNNRTAFLRKSAYTAMVSGGYMGPLVRTELPVKFANLYERVYTRVANNGDWQDFLTFQMLMPAFHAHFDKGRGEFIQPGPEANVRFRNVAFQLVRGITYYQGFLRQTLEDVRDVRGAVEEYLAQG